MPAVGGIRLPRNARSTRYVLRATRSLPTSEILKESLPTVRRPKSQVRPAGARTSPPSSPVEKNDANCRIDPVATVLRAHKAERSENVHQCHHRGPIL